MSILSPLDEYPPLRRALYLFQWVANLVLGIVSLVLLAYEQNPKWWIVTQAAFNFVWTYTGITARKNTP